MPHAAALSLTVLSVAYPFAPVGPDAAGGAEQVLGQLDAALVKGGHGSIVVANAASKVRGTLVPTKTLPGPGTGSGSSIRRGSSPKFSTAMALMPSPQSSLSVASAWPDGAR